ncbi:MAG: adaptor protein MecA [[Clostridium] scindens]
MSLKAARLLSTMYSGSNTLYKDQVEDVYILALTQSDLTTNDFNRICNMLSEYGSLEKASGATLAFLEEHCEVLVSEVTQFKSWQQFNLGLQYPRLYVQINKKRCAACPDASVVICCQLCIQECIDLLNQ